MNSSFDSLSKVTFPLEHDAMFESDGICVSQVKRRLTTSPQHGLNRKKQKVNKLDAC